MAKMIIFLQSQGKLFVASRHSPFETLPMGISAFRHRRRQREEEENAIVIF
jgi:hypothetical protein